MMADKSEVLQAQVAAAYDNKRSLSIQAGNSKQFYGRHIDAQSLDVSEHRGIIEYEPTELVMTARAGTTLDELNAALAENNQMLAFEPPVFNQHSTIGGTVACNFSGPRRLFAGAARDYVLGTRLINGKAEILSFGGQVMKNVAGYDVSRLMAGAMGTLGVLLDVSLKVLPRPETEQTRVIECGLVQALETMQTLPCKAIPLSALSYARGRLYIRLSGRENAVSAAAATTGGEQLAEDAAFWTRLNSLDASVFDPARNLWRLSLAQTTPELNSLSGEWIYDWGGAQRWLLTEESASSIFATAAEWGGHATRMRVAGGAPQSGEDMFQPLDPAMLKIHQNLKAAFDPAGILNPGRQYSQL